jgi:hypothetical protein
MRTSASEAEAALNPAVQALLREMAVTHSLAMEMLGRARRVDQIPQVDCAGNLAVKLLRTYVAQTEALAKLRRGVVRLVNIAPWMPGASHELRQLTLRTLIRGRRLLVSALTPPAAALAMPAPPLLSIAEGLLHCLGNGHG